MTQSTRFSDAPLAATPSLERLLSALGRRLRLFVLLRGLGLALVSFVFWWGWAFFADYVLHVPATVRRVHGVLLFVLPAFVLWRTGLRHLTKIPRRRELAILLEAQRGGEDLFTSAADFQLSDAAQPDGSAPLIKRLFARAEAAAAALGTKLGTLGVLDARRPMQAAGVALALVAALGGSFLVWPDHQGVFTGRMFGAGSPWPQLTFLSVEVPLESGVTATPDGLAVRLARGEDLPVTVLVTGRVPGTVELAFSDGTRRALSPAGHRAGGTVFATTLRSISGDLEFQAKGGDDYRGLARVTVKALSPPDLTRLVAHVTPPAYSGLAPRTSTDSDLVVLSGSRVRLTAEVTPSDATGFVRLLPEDRTVALTPNPEGGLDFSLTAERSLRLRFELTDSEGLANPDPGLWSITVDEDHAPRVSVRSPETLNLETTTDGLLPLWALIQDDFRVVSAKLIVAAQKSGTEERSLPLELRESADEGGGSFAFAPIGLDRLIDTPEAGQTIWVEVEASDNRAPQPGVGHSPKVSVRVLSHEDYMRRVQDRLAGTRRHVSDLFDLQREKLQRTEELVDAFAIDGKLDSAGRGDLSSLVSGTRRIEADATGILRELAGLTSDVLHARIDPDAIGQVEQLDRLMASSASSVFDAGLWDSLVTMHRAGRLGKAGFAGHLIELTGAGLDLSGGETRQAREALDLAFDLAGDASELGPALEDALVKQSQSLAAIEALLGRLAEWDNFQSVLSLTREVLERQRAVAESTKELATQ